MKRAALLFVMLAGPAWGESLPLPSIACDTGGGVTTGTCDAKPEDASASPWTMTKPSRTIAGDMVFSSCTVDTNSTDSFAGGTTWTQIGTDNGNIAGLRLTAWWKIAGDGEPASWTLSGTGGTNTLGACAISLWRSIAQSSAYEGNVVETTGTGTTATCGDITVSANALAICYVGALNDPTYTNSASYIEEIDENGTFHGGRVYPSGGATGDVSITLSTSETWVARHMSFAYNSTGVRLWLPSTGALAISPAFPADWNDTEDADRITAVRTRGSTAITTKSTDEASATNDFDVLARQYGIQVGAQTISGVIQSSIRSAESATGANARAQLLIRLVDSAGTAKSTLLAHNTAANAEEFAANATCASGLAASTYGRMQDARTLTSQDAANNDYLLIEIGSRNHNTSATNMTICHSFGDTASTPMDRDNTETTANSPWIDFLGSGLAAPSSGTASRMTMMGVGR